jgi:sulfur carrier protein
MRIILNKDVQIIPDGISIDALLEHLNIEIKYIAIEVNQKIVPKSEYNTFNLKENDNVEIINAVGGG